MFDVRCFPSFLKIQSNVHRVRRMRQRTDGNEIHTGFRNRLNAGQIHAAAGLGLRAAFDLLHRQPQLHWVHVVEQNDVRARGGGLPGLLQRVSLDLDFQLRIFFARAPRLPESATEIGVRRLSLHGPSC